VFDDQEHHERGERAKSETRRDNDPNLGHRKAIRLELDLNQCIRRIYDNLASLLFKFRGPNYIFEGPAYAQHSGVFFGTLICLFAGLGFSVKDFLSFIVTNGDLNITRTALYAIHYFKYKRVLLLFFYFNCLHEHGPVALWHEF